MKLIKSFGYAFKGIWIALSGQLNLQIHFLAVVLVSAAGFYFHISALEWSILILCFSIVIVAEMINTAIEHLVDLVQPDFDIRAGRIKDIAAGAVLIAAIFAVIIAILTFAKHLCS